MPIRAELLHVETRLFNLLQPIGVNIDGFFSEDLPRGTQARFGTYIVWRLIATQPDRRLLGGEPIASVFDYEVFATNRNETLTAPLSNRADDIYTYLQDTHGAVDGFDISIERLRPFKRRYLQQGQVWSEQGHVFRIFARLATNVSEPALNTTLEFGTLASEVKLHPYCERIFMQRDATLGQFLEFWGFHDTANIINNFHGTFWNLPTQSIIYGPHGDTAGYPKLTGEGTLIHFDIDSSATNNTFNPITFRGRILVTNGFAFGTF